MMRTYTSSKIAKSLMRAAALSAAAVAIAAAFAPSVSAQEKGNGSTVIYRCDTGEAVIFTNVGNTKGCTKLEVQPIMTFPTSRTPATRANAAVASQNAATAAPAPSAFPRVDNDTQRARDGKKRELLEDELKKEEKRLADLEKSFNNGEPERLGNEKNYQKYLDRVEEMRADIKRTRDNIAEIRRELGNR